MSEQQPSNRDEKGLTISGRTMLRILVEFSKTLAASRKLGEDKGLELLQNPAILLEIRSLLWIASQMASRIGGSKEVESYLSAHAEEDEKTVLDGMTETGRELLEDLLAQGGIPKCASCGHLVCPICRECHDCSKNRHHDLGHTPFAPPGKGAPN